MKAVDNHRIRSAVMGAALGIGLGFVTHASGQAQHSYLIDLESKTATDLGNVKATALNDAGQVVGYSPDGSAFITGPNGMGMTYLGMPRYPHGINNAGQVVGYFQGHAFITGPNGVGAADLGLPESSYSYASGINNAGQVVGNYYAMDADHAFITGPNGVGVRELGTFPSGDSSYAPAINATGQVAVNVNGGSEYIRHAFVTGPDGVGATDLGALPGGDYYSNATDINDSGQVVGYSPTVDRNSHAFITGPDGVGLIDLGTLPGGDSSEAYGINNAGQVVGYSGDAFITGPYGAGMTDLNSLVHLPGGAVMDEARAINNTGQVLVLVSYVPEPESYALMLAGLVLTGVMVRRKQKADARERVLSS